MSLGLEKSVPAPGGTYSLGKQDVARIGFGAMQLRRYESTPADAVALLEHAIALGVNHIDTAHFYGNGFVNTVIGKVVRPGDGIVFTSKVGADPDLQAKIPIKLAQRPEQLRASLEDNLVSLGVDHIPLVNLRRPDVGPGLVAKDDQIVDIDDQIAVMVSMRDEGKIGAIGLSAVNLVNLRRALPAGIACVSNAYSLVSREFEDMLEFCMAKTIAWVPFFPLGGAQPGWPKVTDQAKVVAIAERMNVTPSQVGLAWLLRHAPNTLVIPGTTKLEHLEQNIAVSAITLDAGAMADLDSITPSPVTS